MANNRLFFALWPTATISNSIKQNTERLKESVKGKFVPADNWHITLAFLGNVDNKTKDCLIKQASQIQCRSISIEFDTVLFFNKSQIVSFGVSHESDQSNLHFLVNECKRIQQVCGLNIETRKFIPHITVARKVKLLREGFVIEPMLWSATEFVLVLSEISERGSDYTVLKKWPLLLLSSIDK